MEEYSIKWSVHMHQSQQSHTPGWRENSDDKSMTGGWREDANILEGTRRPSTV